MALDDDDVVDDAPPPNTTLAFLLLAAPLAVLFTVAAVACRVLPFAMSEYSMIVVRETSLNANERFAHMSESRLQKYGRGHAEADHYIWNSRISTF